MADRNKPVNNQLFNASITGSTYEEFAQRATLFPAAPSPPAGVNLTTPPHQIPPTPPIVPPQGTSVNTYRRGIGKRPQYAQPPGLSSATQPLTPHIPSNIPPQPPLHTESQSSAFLNPVTTVPELSSWNYSHHPQEQMAAVPAVETPQFGQYAYGPVDGNVLSNTASSSVYRPVYHHWFYKQELEGKTFWHPFSMVDSLALEAAFTSTNLTPETTVATDGGRCDVNILRRQRSTVYWKSEVTEVRRCSWFHKRQIDGRYVPYEENIATHLEEEFKIATETNQWHRKVELANGETVEFHAPDVLVLFPKPQSPDPFGTTPSPAKPRLVKRGMDEFDIDEGESETVDHLLFMVHGIGSVCDLKFRSVEEVVNEFRSIALQLVRSHYKSSHEKGLVNRVEVLPISWHDELHSEGTGIDRKLKSITLESIPRLRDFTNDTLLDILFYTSPCYCQTIISTVGNEMNKVYSLFKQRNPTFNGGVSLGGHSLGSLILFDILCHQHPESEKEPEEPDDGDVITPLKDEKPHPLKRRMSRRISYMMTTSGTGQPQLNYPHINFQPCAFFALGSPIGMFVTVRGLDTLGEQFALPTCPAFFNIFHPYDPVAYRIESLINPQLSSLKPVLIPHHKGRKRMHLELKETVFRVGADLKQRVMESVKSTFNSFYQFYRFNQSVPQKALEEEVDKALEEELTRTAAEEEEEMTQQTSLSCGILNKGRRIDYVLQEAPFEIFNEYIFALTSHVCYWESEDTMLMILKEIYSNLGVQSDNQIPQQTMTIERPPSSPKSTRANEVAQDLNPQAIGMDPTVPIASNVNLGPPPTSGFVKNT